MKNRGQQNIELVKRVYEAVRNRDFTNARNLLDKNIEWVEPEAPGLWFSGTRRGADTVFREVIEPTYNKIADFRFEMNQYFDIGDYVLVTGRFYGRSKSTGKEVNASTAHVWTVQDGKLTRFVGYHDMPQWLDVLGVTAQSQRMAA